MNSVPMSVARCCGVTAGSCTSSSYKSESISIWRMAPIIDLGFLVMVAMSPTSTDTLPSLLTRFTAKDWSQHSTALNSVGPMTRANSWSANSWSAVGVRSITWMVGVSPPPKMGTLARPITRSRGSFPAPPGCPSACTTDPAWMNASLAQQSMHTKPPRQGLEQPPSRSTVMTGKMAFPLGSRALNCSTTEWLGAQKHRVQHSLCSSTLISACCVSRL
mmetsp:Transcript_4683/g.11621  ORF Transcript_4683/g.11621 Transcript_4683/m.11621 type:complete len:218 (-) Transcript_4683:210-863(-)